MFNVQCQVVFTAFHKVFYDNESHSLILCAVLKYIVKVKILLQIRIDMLHNLKNKECFLVYFEYFSFNM